MKLRLIAVRSSGMLARNVTPRLISPAGGAACDAGADSGTASSAATARVRSLMAGVSTPDRSLLREVVLETPVGHQPDEGHQGVERDGHPRGDEGETKGG